MRVGLLEDEVAIQEMLLLMLQDEGYTVINFPDAEECLAILGDAVQQGTSLPVDLMIIDWRLTGSISGVEVIRHIQNVLHLDSLPIILTTAAAVSSDTEELQDVHVALIEKPFAIDELVTLIKTMLSHHSESVK
jgi:two-component system, chemotaxis family, chemotaxis protein CheY